MPATSKADRFINPPFCLQDRLMLPTRCSSISASRPAMPASACRCAGSERTQALLTLSSLCGQWVRHLEETAREVEKHLRRLRRAALLTEGSARPDPVPALRPNTRLASVWECPFSQPGNVRFSIGMAMEVVTSMEMTELGQLRSSRPSPEPIELEEVGPSVAEAFRSMYIRVWEPLESGGRMEWSVGDWEAELLRSGVKAWLPRVGGETVGLVELELGPTGDVGIVVFGLVPEFIGRGFGGAFLTATVRLAWNMSSGRPVRRVWVQTSSGDHPNAIANYKSRGFVVFQTQPKQAPGESLARLGQ